MTKYYSIQADCQEAYDNGLDVSSLIDTHKELGDLNETQAAQLRARFNKHLASKAPVSVDDLIGFEVETLQARPIDSHKPKDFLIKRLQLNKGNLILLVAAGESGKSMFLQYLGLCVATGTNLFDTFDVKQGKVLHIDQEQSLNQTSVRYSRIAKGMKIDAFDIERMYLKSRLDLYPTKMQEVEDALVKKITGYSLVLIDSLKKISSVDENSSEIERVLNLLKRAAERANCVIVLIHHKGKGKSDARQSGRGHSSIYDSCDIQIDLDHENGEPFEITCAKNRDGRHFAGIKYDIQDRGEFVVSQDCHEELVFSLLQESVKPKTESTKKMMLQAVAESEHNLTQLFDRIKGDRGQFEKVLAECLNEKIISEAVGARRSRLFTITDEGRSFLAYEGESK